MDPTETINKQIEEIEKLYPDECKDGALGYIVEQIREWNNQATDYIENDIS